MPTPQQNSQNQNQQSQTPGQGQSLPQQIPSKTQHQNQNPPQQIPSKTQHQNQNPPQPPIQTPAAINAPPANNSSPNTGTEKKIENSKNQKKKRRKRRKKGRSPILSLIIVATIAILGYRGYQWVEEKIQEQQDYINDNFSDSVNTMLEETSETDYVRGLHDIKDPFEGWEHYTFQTIKMRYPPRLYTRNAYINKPSCRHSSTAVDFVSSEYEALKRGVKVTGTPQQQFDFYANAVGFTLCQFPNPQNLDLIDFVNNANTWLPDTQKYNGKIDRSKIVKNWTAADIDINSLKGKRYEGNLQNGGESQIFFLQDLATKDIYIIDVDLQYHNPEADSTLELKNFIHRLVTSFR
jgi:hypothetical protein